MTFEQALAGYLANTRRPRSVCKATARWWRKFTDFCYARGLNFLALEPAHFEDFQRELHWEPSSKGLLYRANTVDQILRSTREVLRWATTAGHLDRDPSRELRLPRPPQPARHDLAWEEVQSILQSPDRSKPNGLRDATILAVILEADLDVKDCLALQLGEQARLPLESATHDLVAAYIQQARPLWLRATTASKLLFLNQFGGPLGVQTVTNALRQGARDAGLSEPPTMKCLRRSYRARLQSLTQSRIPPSFNRDL